MTMLQVSIVASIAIISVSIVTMKTIKMILSDDINLAGKVNVISKKDR